MTVRFPVLACVALTCGTLVACDGPVDSTEEGATVSDAQQPAGSMTTNSDLVERVETQDGTASAGPVIASSPWTGGATLDITKLATTGDILTMEIRVQGGERTGFKTINVREVNYIEDQSATKVDALQDDDGRYMANPLSSLGYTMSMDTSGSVGWIKFPKPSQGTKTISITIPGAGALDGILLPSS